MESTYRELKKSYKLKIEMILLENLPTYPTKYIPVHFKCQVERAIIPFIPNCCKTHFLSVTPLNLFTKDDPVLRYVPSVKANSTSTITFYDETSYGTKSFDISDMADLLFIRHFQKKVNNHNDQPQANSDLNDQANHNDQVQASAQVNSDINYDLNSDTIYMPIHKPIYNKPIEFIKKTFGRNPVDFLTQKTENLQPCDLFCSTCLIFNCGFHKLANPEIIKFNEKSTCICRTINKNCNALQSLQFTRRSPLKLKSCIQRKLFNLRLPCRSYKDPLINKKKITQTSKCYDNLMFYEPCVGEKCGCSNVYCEYFCGCKNCSNVMFCRCKACNKDCPCFKNSRECTEACSGYRVNSKAKDKCNGIADKQGVVNKVYIANNQDLANKAGMANGIENKSIESDKSIKSDESIESISGCKNMPILNNSQRKVSICRSSKHGLGLFAEEFIANGTFVIEYTGELITDKEAERRGNFYEMNRTSYLFNCIFTGENCLFSLDAFFIGNKSRFINHSTANSNLIAKIMISHGISKIVFYSTRDIYRGEEFLFDYQFTAEHKVKHGILD